MSVKGGISIKGKKRECKWKENDSIRKVKITVLGKKGVCIKERKVIV